MNSIGNDNYRPGMKPPEPVRQSSGWLSSNMAQLMVFLNGLILTITAFATLSVFIGEIIQDGFKQTTEDTEQYITVQYNEAERILFAMSALSSGFDKQTQDKVSKYLTNKVAGKNYFDSIYSIQKDETGEWNIANIYSGKGVKSDYLQKSEIIKLIEGNNAKAGAVSYLKNSDNQNYNIALLHQSNIDQSLYLIGVTDFQNLILNEWLQKKESVHDMQIMGLGADFPLFSYDRAGNNSNGSIVQTMNFVPNDIAGLPFEVSIGLSMSDREAFLQKIPLLMLVFGITLTLIGTLYVRNNQTQSKKLAIMNKELAHKNYELNQEVSERERLNQVIQKSARDNKAVINAVSDIIFELSTDGTILFLNETWNKVTGFELERSIGRNLIDLLYAQDQEEQKLYLEQLAKGQKRSYRTFTRLRSSDGSYRAIELAVSMMRQDENQNMRVVGTITDVEERRRAERALSEAEKKYRAIVENAAGGIYQVTPEGQFLSANPAFAKITGYEKPEDVLRDISNANDQLYLDAPYRDKFLSGIVTLDTTGNFESQIKRKDGKIIWVNENVRPVKDDEGTLLFFEGSMEDVDQRKKAEIALREAKIESDLANRSKSEFLANMSHELRTPLNSVIGFSEIIKNETFGNIEQQEYKEYASNIFSSGNKLLRVINEILDVSRIEAGERTLNETAVKVSDVVTSCLEMVEGKIKSAEMRIENKIKNSPYGFVVEAQAVKQMLLNLLSNAIRFSPANSLIMLDAEIDSRGRLRLSVTDTGVGLNEEELEKAMSPFGQINSEHNRSGSGTGLGLTLVKSLIELHGGELEMVSQKNIGTTATLIFPEKRVAQVKNATNEESAIQNIKSASKSFIEEENQ